MEKYAVIYEKVFSSGWHEFEKMVVLRFGDYNDALKAFEKARLETNGEALLVEIKQEG